ncbi:MAG: sigma factor-like helix-turn-helix DNA-binding protein [Nocardioides sp.]
MPVAVLTLDQRRSRGADDAVPALLSTLARDLPAPPLRGFERTAGDEVQGVVDDPDTTVELLARLLRSGGWNLGLGIGEVEHPLPAQTRAGRGEAFLAAREAVTRAKAEPHRLAVVAATGQEDATALETVLGLWAGLLERRTEGGWEVYDALTEDLTYVEVGERLGISQSAVSQRARAAGIVDEGRARALVSVLCERLLG